MGSESSYTDWLISNRRKINISENAAVKINNETMKALPVCLAPNLATSHDTWPMCYNLDLVTGLLLHRLYPVLRNVTL